MRTWPPRIDLRAVRSPALRPLCAKALTTFAASVLVATSAAGQAAPDCGNTTGTAVFDAGSNSLTCAGNNASGISTFADTLFVAGLTGNIWPSAGFHGIELFGSNPVTLESTLGGFSIVTTGPETHGINADRQQGVTINHSGNISATGEGSFGIKGRSSQGEVAISSSGDLMTGEVGAGIFANTAQGSITVLHDGDITGGANSSGIQATIDQSGNGATISITSTGNINLGGGFASTLAPAAGIYALGFNDISIVSAGNITTASDAVHGISAATPFGNVSIATMGNVTVMGSQTSAIYVEGGNTNSVRILDGTLSTTSETYGTVTFNGNSGGSNRLDNYGTIVGNPIGAAIVTNGLGRSAVNNFGTIIGDVYLYTGSDAPPSGANSFTNAPGAVFSPASGLELGAGGIFTNHGTLSPGGPGAAAVVTLGGGNFLQSTTGQIAIDIDMRSDASDRIIANGTAQLAGKVVPNLMNIGGANFNEDFKIVTAGAGVTNNGLTVSDTALIDYSLLYPNANDVVLSVRVNFDVPGLTPNQSSVLDYFGRGAAGGGAGLQPTLLALLNAPDAATIAAITGQLYSNAAGGAASSAIHFGDALAAALRSCPVADGTYGQLRETSCVWAKPTYRQFSQAAGTSRALIADDTSGISGGFQTALTADIWGGLGFSLEESNTLIDHSTRVDGTWWQVGGVAKWTQGPWKLSGSISGGQGDLDTVRAINIPGLSTVASSGTDTGFATGLARLACTFGVSGFYVTPMLNIGFNYINIDGFTESGASALNLLVAPASETIFSAGPAVEIGATIMAEGLTFRPYAKFGVTLLSEDTFTTQARFAAAPETIAPFTTQTRFDDVYADVSAGVQWFSGSRINLRLNYDGRFGDASEQHGVDAKLTVNY